jgi:hypothetical protein
MERSAALALLHQYVKGDGLTRHCLATGAIMKSVAGFFSQDPAHWEEIGILHDIDFEYVKEDMQQHGTVGAQLLKTAGVPDDIGEIVRKHNHFLHTGTYESPVEITLQAAGQRIRTDYCLCTGQRWPFVRCFCEDPHEESKGEVLCCRV